jgi:hypothetical protein
MPKLAAIASAADRFYDQMWGSGPSLAAAGV